ncbi:hypothetical protein PG993_008023 [Apiospora rasikravindrae]|uniref:Uncharacterized protein n=1 Tax=Apiospora rasikravindrae TaxID=990691 RepID=A0ABR1SZ58_9PEZI
MRIKEASFCPELVDGHFVERPDGSFEFKQGYVDYVNNYKPSLASDFKIESKNWLVERKRLTKSERRKAALVKKRKLAASKSTKKGQENLMPRDEPTVDTSDPESELLALGNFQGPTISYHDDGEKELGPTDAPVEDRTGTAGWCWTLHQDHAIELQTMASPCPHRVE